MSVPSCSNLCRGDFLACTAHAQVVARGAFLRMRVGVQGAGAQCFGRRRDFGFHVFDKVLVHCARIPFALVQFVDFDKVGVLAGQLLIAEGVDMKLSLGDLFGLGAVIGFEVNDSRLAGVLPADKVNATDDADTIVEGDVDLLLGEFDVLEVGLIVLDVIRDDARGCLFKFLAKFCVGVWRVEVPLGQAVRLGRAWRSRRRERGRGLRQARCAASDHSQGLHGLAR